MSTAKLVHNLANTKQQIHLFVILPHVPLLWGIQRNIWACPHLFHIQDLITGLYLFGTTVQVLDALTHCMAHCLGSITGAINTLNIIFVFFSPNFYVVRNQDHIRQL